jgi:PAS domain S-box-containing protein
MRQSAQLKKIYWLSGFLLVFVLAFLTSAIFLNPSSVGNQNFLFLFNFWAFLWAVIFVIVLILTFVLARNLIRLFFEFQSRDPGSRIKTKLILTFIIFSLFPALILFFLSFGLINQNLTKWVSAPSDLLLESSSVIAEDFYNNFRQTSILKAQTAALHLEGSTFLDSSKIGQVLRQYGFSAVAVIRSDGQILLRTDQFPNQRLSDSIDEALLDLPLFIIDEQVNLNPGIVDSGIIGVPFPESPEDTFVFFAFTIPNSLKFHVGEIRKANEVYKQLRGTLESVRMHYFLVLGLTTLTVIFSFAWLGSYIARKLTIPLEALARGSQEIAEGNLDYRVGVQAVDELGVLVGSFNRMAEQLKENRKRLEDANLELIETNTRLEERRKYTETILQNIATGVLTIDGSEVIQTVNQAALKILQATRSQLVDKKIRKVTDAELYKDFRGMEKRARLYGSCRRRVTFKRNDRQLYLAVTMSIDENSGSENPGYIIVLDDLTELIRAEKFAAWQEVARRLAHEVKNPLTPIQLSAERIQKRFEKISEHLPKNRETEEFGQILKESSRIITAESLMLKNLLAEFSAFARLPISKPIEVDLHRLVEKTLTLYDGSIKSVQIRKEFDPKISKVNADPNQLQRVLINLIDNALDAMLEEVKERVITVRTAINRIRGSISVEISDTGRGIEAGDYEQLFLPYFSTKKKGTGLGLAISRQIISEHKGFIRAEPNVPRGTRIIFEIPVNPDS